MTLRLANVVAVHPDRGTVELVYLDNGARVGEAHVASGVVGSDAGVWAVPSVLRPASERLAGTTQGNGRRLVAVVAEISTGRSSSDSCCRLAAR
ncbi:MULTISPECIES: hypothetical protein [Roseomonadaceae]|uniref:Uncharacterized protein n=1 Tax=Falsiroseomonas oleicola TaxID=2801474 RepID=A0ABS6HET0_9PROT|nr:hypothetical protein [Roseomonas oleicola]MBU8545785.1 hypothetical protein [Roseomonas oleicola]